MRIAPEENTVVWDVCYSCDICGEKKGDDSQWWMAVLGEVPCFEEGGRNQRFTLIPWNPNESQSEQIHHLCGQRCALQAMERFMTNGKIELEPSSGTLR